MGSSHSAAGVSGAGVERLTSNELGWRMHRNPSMISRLYGWYQGHRNKQTEKKLARELAKQSVLGPDPVACPALNALFDSPTIAEMAGVIEANLAKLASHVELERMLSEVEAMSNEQAQSLEQPIKSTGVETP